MLAENKFGVGAHPDKFDSRDHQFLGGSAPFDWSLGYDIETVLSQKLKQTLKLPVKDQGTSQSCGGQAWSQYQGVLEAMFDGSFEERSAKYIYAQTHSPQGGSYGRDNAALCVKQGVAREQALTSYIQGQPPDESFLQRSRDITDSIRQDAAIDKSVAYAQVSPNIDLVAQAIRDNYGCVIGLYGQDNGSWSTSHPRPPVIPTSQCWAHWVYAGKVKVENGVKYIGVINSWGTDVGDKGWQWLPESYFQGYVFNCWTMVFDAQNTKNWLADFITKVLAILRLK